ncbi:hypothetical protein PG997_000536 [Apiospora hydei]|uniref:Uncharacterized protein n=1 Tax=Apiospora hydei TaxID=1337664 RepID=A0ABR1XB23_9PEZI
MPRSSTMRQSAYTEALSTRFPRAAQHQQQQQYQQYHTAFEPRHQVKSDSLPDDGLATPPSTPGHFYGGSDRGAGTHPLRGGGARGRGRAASEDGDTHTARRGHLQRMAETLADFGEEVFEAQQAPHESEEWESEIDSLRRLYDKMLQKLERLELLPPAEE